MSLGPERASKSTTDVCSQHLAPVSVLRSTLDVACVTGCVDSVGHASVSLSLWPAWTHDEVRTRRSCIANTVTTVGTGGNPQGPILESDEAPLPTHSLPGVVHKTRWAAAAAASPAKIYSQCSPCLSSSRSFT